MKFTHVFSNEEQVEVDVSVKAFPGRVITELRGVNDPLSVNIIDRGITSDDVLKITELISNLVYELDRKSYEEFTDMPAIGFSYCKPKEEEDE